MSRIARTRAGAAPPARPPTRLALKVRPSSRIAAFIAAVLVLFLGIVLWMLLLAFPVGDIGSLAGRAFWLLGAIALAAVLWGAFMGFREAFRRPALMVGDEVIEIHNAILLRHPLRFRRAEVAAVAVDHDADRGFWDADDVPVEVEYESGFMIWKAGREENLAATNELTRLFVPVVDRDAELKPNVAVVLNAPIDISSYKRRSVGPGGFNKTLTGTKTTQGFLACVREPTAAASAFERMGLLDKLGSRHLALLEPRKEDYKRLRRGHHVLAFSIAWGVLVLADYLWKLISD